MMVRTALIGLATLLGVTASLTTGAGAKGDRELGEYLSSQCTACHQISGRQVGGIPAIVALPEDQFVALVMAYKDGVRDNEAMKAIAHRLSREDIEALAAYFGSLKPR